MGCISVELIAAHFVCYDAATEELKVGTYRYFKDIEAGHLDPESLIK